MWGSCGEVLHRNGPISAVLGGSARMRRGTQTRSTTGFAPILRRAGGGDRTLIASLEGWSSTIELHPRALHSSGPARYPSSLEALEHDLPVSARHVGPHLSSSGRSPSPRRRTRSIGRGRCVCCRRDRHRSLRASGTGWQRTSPSTPNCLSRSPARGARPSSCSSACGARRGAGATPAPPRRRGFDTHLARRPAGDHAIGYLHAEHRRFSPDRRYLDRSSRRR